MTTRYWVSYRSHATGVIYRRDFATMTERELFAVEVSAHATVVDRWDTAEEGEAA